MPSASADNMNAGDGDSIKVYLRVRPPDQDNGIDSGQILTVQPPNVVILPCKPEPKVFTFDHVADIHTTQEAVFSAVGRKTIESCVAGYNATIFAYGQTGSGKTFTMLGSEEADNFHHELRGVIPRSFEYLFGLVNREREKQGERFEFLCRVSFLEIYNEQVYDLLDPASTGLQLRENFKRGVFVDGLIEQVVISPSDAYKVLSAGWLNRRVAATSMNRESSRSHAVFTFSIHTKEKKAGVSNIRVSQLNLVDLAGSERQKDTKTSGIRLKEAGSINKSLLTLGHVMTALVDIGHGKTRHVPYRDSKLSFLLRDSLGGNAKTYIIANVHPGARCFGETLSTLNFARRAKMIKNKAVVNEDTQGNTVHLQLEIKRLREQLLQFTQGGIPREPTNTAQDTPCSNVSTPSTGGMSTNGKWRNHFLDAMYLREKTENERKNLLEKISTLEDLASKKQQYLQSTKMIVRFRENTIARLQKNQNNEEADESQLVSDLKQEVAALKQQLANNPTVTQYAMENHNLRNENKKLKTLQSVQSGMEYDNERAQQLDKAFRELMASMEGDRRTSSCPSPSRTPSQHEDHHVAVSSTLDKYKTQIKKIQAERDSTQQELAEQTEVWSKTRLKLEAEVASYKKTINELENALEAFKVKTKIERDTMNNLHMQTIMTMATPKKAAYNLRNRVVTVPTRDDDTTPVNPHQLLMQSPEASAIPLNDEEGISEEEIPEHMIEQCNEALMDEVRKLRDENSQLQQNLQDEESKCLKMKQTETMLEQELNQKNQLLETEQKQKAEFQTKASKLALRIENMQRDYCIAKSEAEDMRIMLQSADKVMDEERKRLKDSASQRERSLAALESKVLSIEIEFSTAQQDVEKLTENKRELQEISNTLQEEVNFKEQRQDELEGVIKAERGHIQDMQQEIQSLMEKLDAELEKNATLSAELREGSESKQELLETLELVEQLRCDIGQLHNQCSDKDAQLSKTKDDLETTNVTIATLNKRTAEDKEALAAMVISVQDLRGTIVQRDDTLGVLGNELSDTRRRCESLQVAQDENMTEVQGLHRELEETTLEVTNLSCAHNMEIERLQEDFDEVRCQYQSLLSEMTQQEENLQTAQMECEVNALEVIDLRKQLSDKDEEICTLQEVCETQLEEAKANLSTIVIETDPDQESQLIQTINNQAAEIESLRTGHQKFSGLVEQFETMREAKNLEIQELKDSLSKLEQMEMEKELLEAKYQTLQYKAEEWEERAKEKDTELQFSNRELRGEVSRMNAAFDSANRLKDEAVEARLNTETELAQLKCNNELMQENVEQILEELERTKTLESSHFEERENLKSCLGQLQEEKIQLEKEMKRLDEKNEELTAVNNKLSGHQNLKQKIHYHQQVKIENAQLKEQLYKFRNDSKFIKGELEQYRKMYGDLKHYGNGNDNSFGNGHTSDHGNGHTSDHGSDHGCDHGSDHENDTMPLEAVKENIDPRTVTS